MAGIKRTTDCGHCTLVFILDWAAASIFPIPSSQSSFLLNRSLRLLLHPSPSGRKRLFLKQTSTKHIGPQRFPISSFLLQWKGQSRTLDPGLCMDDPPTLSGASTFLSCSGDFCYVTGSFPINTHTCSWLLSSPAPFSPAFHRSSICSHYWHFRSSRLLLGL